MRSASPPAASRACSRSRSIPKFATNGKLYVYFTNKSGNEEIWELRARKGAASIRPGHRKVLEIADTEGNHNGGQLQFGPDGDALLRRRRRRRRRRSARRARQRPEPRRPARQARAHRRGHAHGRQGVRHPEGQPVRRPGRLAPEIWALGLRNPWRFSFDRANGDLWIGDVGQNAWEEVDHVKRGVGGINFGWNRYEGRHDFASGTPLVGGQLRGPVAEYSHSDGCSITGGYVYRGPRIAGLSGRYVYADYCSGKMWTLATSGGAPRDVSSVASDAGAKAIVSFGQDGSGMLYVCSAEDSSTASSAR